MGDLSRWAALTKAHRVVAHCGDSTVQGTVGQYSSPWPTQVRNSLGAYFGGNPGWGYFTPWRGAALSSDATLSYLDSNADWTQGAPTTNDRRVLFNQSRYRTGTTTSTQAVRLTRPAAIPIHHFDIWYVDSAGSGDIDVSIDGAAYFTVDGAALGDHGLKFATVLAPANSTIRVRPNGGTELVYGGFNLWSQALPAQSCTVHNVGRDSQWLWNFMAVSTSLDWLDIVQPDLCTIMFTNDFTQNSLLQQIDITNYAAAVTAYQNNLQAFYDRVSGYADVLIMAPFEQKRTTGSRPQADDRTIQAAFRQACLDVAAANPHAQCLNVFDTWGHYEDADAAGLFRILPDGVTHDPLHESQAGHDSIAQLVISAIQVGSTRPEIAFTPAPLLTSTILDTPRSIIRRDSFEFILADSDRTELGRLPVTTTGQTPTITLDTSRTTFRSASGIASLARPSEVDLGRERVIVRMKLQNGQTWTVGVFMFGDDPTEPHTFGNIWTPELQDETFLFDQDLDRSWSRPPGSSVLELFTAMAREVLDPLGIPSDYAVADVENTSPLLYKVGTNRNTALRALAALLGCFPPFFGNDGWHRLKPAQIITADTNADHRYGVANRVRDKTARMNRKTWQIPNEYIVVGDELAGGVPVQGIYQLPDTHPFSIANRGYKVTNTHTVAGVQSTDLAALIAYTDAVTDRRTYQTASFVSPADPRHDTYDLVRLSLPDDELYIETGWTLEVKNGGQMTHNLQRLWAPAAA